MSLIRKSTIPQRVKLSLTSLHDPCSRMAVRGNRTSIRRIQLAHSCLPTVASASLETKPIVGSLKKQQLVNLKEVSDNDNDNDNDAGISEGKDKDLVSLRTLLELVGGKIRQTDIKFLRFLCSDHRIIYVPCRLIYRHSETMRQRGAVEQPIKLQSISSTTLIRVIVWMHQQSEMEMASVIGGKSCANNNNTIGKGEMIASQWEKERKGNGNTNAKNNRENRSEITQNYGSNTKRKHATNPNKTNCKSTIKKRKIENDQSCSGCHTSTNNNNSEKTGPVKSIVNIKNQMCNVCNNGGKGKTIWTLENIVSETQKASECEKETNECQEENSKNMHISERQNKQSANVSESGNKTNSGNSEQDNSVGKANKNENTGYSLFAISAKKTRVSSQKLTKICETKDERNENEYIKSGRSESGVPCDLDAKKNVSGFGISLWEKQFLGNELCQLMELILAAHCLGIDALTSLAANYLNELMAQSTRSELSTMLQVSTRLAEVRQSLKNHRPLITEILSQVDHRPNHHYPARMASNSVGLKPNTRRGEGHLR
ncbi:ABC transporter H family member 2 [Drosophila gunungcola]|uniref:ABC transporter H family member 2 n=1 Tax=Drosophila gunungcola TaxID=103775 RepID=UPI0022E32AB3|nr:ABC transporter H family member 2 [Drosophila gunungcola]